MRIAAIAATEAGIQVCAPVHDAFLIAAPLDRLEADITAMRDMMTKAGRAVTGGLDIRTDAEIVRWPDRYKDERGRAMWEKVMSLLEGPSKGRMRRSENRLSCWRNGGVAPASRRCRVGVTPYHLINMLYMSIYTNKDTLLNQDDIKETEVKTNLVRQSKIRPGRTVSKGPISMREIASAARLPGQALAVLLGVHHQSALNRQALRHPACKLLVDLGISRSAKSRGFTLLEKPGLVTVARSRGRAAKIQLKRPT